MSGEVLLLAHRMPFPPDRGDKIRSSHILRHIAGLAPVHVATFAENDADAAQEPELAGIASSHCLVRRSKPLALAGCEALLRRKPISQTAFHSARLQAYVEQILRTRPISAIYIFSGQMGQYVPRWFNGQTVLDLVDVDSAKFEAYAAAGTGPRGWIDGREGRLLAAEEARLSQRSSVTLLVSDEEAALFRARAGTSAGNVRAIRNGIDCDLFNPATVAPDPNLAAFPAPRLIFTGQMDYAPNIAAAERAITRLMPAIRDKVPEATLHVVGRQPPASLRAHHGRNGCHVWGEVADMRAWLRGSDIALVPLDIARGVQNKVLEAMAMAMPVVLSPGAATGIGGSDGVHFRIGSSDEELVQQVLTLISDWDKAITVGHRARDYVANTLSWPGTLAPLADLLGLPAERSRDAA